MPSLNHTPDAYPSPAHRVSQDGLGSGLPNAIDVLEGNLNSLSVGDLDVVDTEVLDPQGCPTRRCGLGRDRARR